MSVVHARATSRVVRADAALREDEVATAKTTARTAMLAIAPRPHHRAGLLRRCGCFRRRPERFCCFGMLLDRLIMTPSFYPSGISSCTCSIVLVVGQRIEEQPGQAHPPPLQPQ